MFVVLVDNWRENVKKVKYFLDNKLKMEKKILSLFADKKQILFFWCFIFIAIFFWGSVMFIRKDTHGSADEKVHIEQIKFFIKGKYEMVPSITNIPAYHAIIAFFTIILFEDRTRLEMHFISFPLALLSIWAFYLLAKKLAPENWNIRTLQYVFLPISFFYYPFIYVDIFSLFLVLIAFYLSISKRYAFSAVFSLFSVMVRQVNIVWVAFIVAYLYVNENGFLFSKKAVFMHIKKSFGQIVVFFAFLGFVFVNGGIAVGDKEHQQAGFYMGNIYFFLFFDLHTVFTSVNFVFKKNKTR